jgi:hypothetical protein
MAISMKLYQFFINIPNKEILLTTEIAQCKINNWNCPMSKRPHVMDTMIAVSYVQSVQSSQ